MPELLEVGDLIEFDYFGRTERGRIRQVGNHGYWISDRWSGSGNGSIRCPFNKAKLIEKGEAANEA